VDEPWDEWVLVGRIARPHGHRGEVIVNPDTDFPETRFAAGATVWMARDGRPTPIVIRASRLHQGRPVLALEGVASMDEAATLHGVELRVPKRELRPLPEGTYYRHDLVGCEVVTTAGDVIGPVRAIEGEQGRLRLVIGEGRGEILVPLAEPICVRIDMEARRIVVDPPEGLLEINR
jgi:16S rRNA processing protein RimM